MHFKQISEKVLYEIDSYFLFQILNIIILVLYSKSGVGYSYNDSNPIFSYNTIFPINEREIAASGVIVGFLIFNIVALVTYCFGQYKEKKPLMVSIQNIYMKYTVKNYITKFCVFCPTVLNFVKKMQNFAI